MNINYILMTHGILKNPITPPQLISNFTSTIANKSINLSWTNPNDNNFIGVRIQRKIGSYPVSPTDGDTVFDGFATSFKDSKNLSDSEVYYYSAYSYGYKNNINHIAQQTSVNYKAPKIYTVIINTYNSNPLTSVSYADDAVGMTPGSNSWDNVFPFSEIKPVMLKNGVVNYYLNPNNFAQKINGSPADITSGADGDVMIQFPKVYMYIRRVGSSIHVSLSQTKVDANYKCFAHTKGGIEKDYLYIAAYFANVFTGQQVQVLSVSSYYGSSNHTLDEFRSFIQTKGTGYQMFSYYQLLLTQVLYLIRYKNLNSQTAVGMGFVQNPYDQIDLGAANDKGMYFGETTGTVVMKLFGIENLWGYINHWIEGIMVDSSYNLLIGDNNFNNAGTGYTNFGKLSGSVSGYISDVQGNNETGFIPKSVSGSSTTYYSDYGTITPDSYAVLESAGLMEKTGLFSISFIGKSTEKYRVTRLSYL